MAAQGSHGFARGSGRIHLGAGMAEGGDEQVFTSFYGYFFGADAPAAAAQARAAWQAWIDEHCPRPQASG